MKKGHQVRSPTPVESEFDQENIKNVNISPENTAPLLNKLKSPTSFISGHLNNVPVARRAEIGSILVAGGAGYIGTHTIVLLINAGYSVTVVDNLVNSSEEALNRVKKICNCDPKRITFCNVDMCDKSALEKVFQDSPVKFKSCIHFAGLKAVGESVMKPLWYYENNLLDFVIEPESLQVYGSAEVPISETTPVGVGISNPYGKTKYMIEEILQDFKKSKDLDKDAAKWSIVILRYFNPVGAHPSGLIGEDPNGPPNNLMPYIAQVAVGKREFLTIFGNDYPTHDGTGVRDYIHVMDLAEGHISALNYMEVKSNEDESSGFNKYSTFNLGSGIGYSVLDMINAMRRVSGVDLKYKFGPRREGDVTVCYADCSKAQQLLGWTATRTLDDMCKDTWNWQSTNPNGYK